MSSPSKRCSKLAAVAVVLTATAACVPLQRVELAVARWFAGAGPETAPLARAPAPIADPGTPVTRSFEVRDLLTDERRAFRVTRLRADAVRVRQSDGCVWTRWGDWFAPSDSWAACDDSRHWHTGRATVRPLETIWPMEVGAVGRYRRTAVSHTGRRYTRDTVCRVSDAVEVRRAGHPPTPAFVVDCADGKRVRTTWYAPGEGPVAFRKVHREKGVEEAWVRR
jgi:hypothetical protein